MKQCFLESLKLGFTSFGGPVAHLGYFRHTYVERLMWLDEEEFSELIALCQFIPGPASSQLGALIGYKRGGFLGAFASWVGFTLPSAVIMTAMVLGLTPLNQMIGIGWIAGLKLVAVSIVAQAVLAMAQKLCTGRVHVGIAIVTVVFITACAQAWAQPLAILLGAGLGFIMIRANTQNVSTSKMKLPIVSFMGAIAFVFAVFSLSTVNQWGLLDAATVGLLRAGSLVFGGGHVVLPLLEQSFVANGLLDQNVFLAGYGMAQAVPGPMFTLGSYLGAVSQIGGGTLCGGVLGTVAIFAPGMLLVTIGMPMWTWLKHVPRTKSVLQGANAAVVGLLATALIHFGTSGVVSTVYDLIFVTIFGVMLWSKKVPTWAIVILSAIAGNVLF